MAFKETYLHLKNERNMSDPAIREQLDLTKDMLTHLKKINGLGGIRKKRANKIGLTEEQLRHGEARGLSRRLMLQRVREKFWTPQDAISLPPTQRGKRRGSV